MYMLTNALYFVALHFGSQAKGVFMNPSCFLNISEFAFSCFFILCESQFYQQNIHPLAGTSSGAIVVIYGFRLQPHLDHLGIEHVDLPDWCRPPSIVAPKMLEPPMIGLFSRGLAASRCEEMLLPLGGPANEFCYMDSTLRCRKSTTGIFDVFFWIAFSVFIFLSRDVGLQLATRRTVIWKLQASNGFLQLHFT